MAYEFDLVVFSHLRWSFVWQRPQHLLSRMARQRRILFIEEPIFEEGSTNRWDISEPNPNVIVCKPVTGIREPGFHAAQMDALRSLLQELISQQKVNDYATWFYTPMAVPLLAGLQPLAIVYDCMDELSAFKHAPPELLVLEANLLSDADIVFTGGPSLYRAKVNRHQNVHCFSSSVDAAHFGKARGDITEPEDQAALPHPRLGFFGVIDERFDIEILAGAAHAKSDWQFVMVGPVVKIDPEVLPRLPNILYTGQRTYEQLPGYLSGWDVCLLPFARNEATRFISPTKTLEYMAADKPIVSTSITDVVEPYRDVVYFGDTVGEFVAACERALSADQDEARQRSEKMRAVLGKTSWDSTVNQMDSLLSELVAHAAADRGRLQGAGAQEQRQSQSQSNQMQQQSQSQQHSQTLTAAAGGDSASQNEPDTEAKVVVIGAGPTGLSAAYHLGSDALLLEQNDTVGGWCRSIELDGFTFDFAGHIMFSNDPYVHEMYATLLGDNVHWQDREAWIFSKDVYTRYPFQGALYGLPPDVIKECLAGAIESRFGNLKPGAQASPKPSGTNGCAHNGHNAALQDKSGDPVNRIDRLNQNQKVEDCCADGVMESTAPLQKAEQITNRDVPPDNFEEFIYKVWGRGIAKHFAIPYNRKLWAVPLTEMETSWLGGRVPLPDLEEMIEGALSPVPKPMGPNARFGYPLRGGFQALMNGFLPLLQGPVRLQTKVAGFSPKRHELTLNDGTTVKYEQLISTMPLPVLIRLAGDEAPEAVREAAKGLRYISVRCVHLGVGRENLTEKHWIYYPEDSIFHRIFVQGNASPHCNPPGAFGLTCEITYHHESKPLPCDGDELIQRCIDDCRKVGFFNEDDEVVTATQVDMPHAYVIYDHARVKNVAIIRDWLATQDVILAGRYSEWEYYNSDHAFLAGKKAADRARELAGQSDLTPAQV